MTVLLALCMVVGVACISSNTNEKYAIIYKDANATDFGGVLDADSPREHQKGETTVLKGASRDGFVFEGWYLNYNALFEPVTELTDENFEKTNIVTLYAKWSEAQSYTVTFDKQGGDGGTDTLTLYYGQDLPYKIETPQKQDYIFGGYFDQIDEEGNTIGKQYFGSLGEPIVDKWDKQSDAVLYAKWIKDEVYTITFDKQGGTLGTDDISIRYGQDMPSVQIPQLQDSIFVGYFDQIDGNGTRYYDTTGDALVEQWDREVDTTLYAKWVDKDKQFDIEFDKQGGQGGDSSTQVGFLQDMPQVVVPYLDEYIFEGYFDNPNGLGIQYYDNSGNSVGKWDKWQDVTYTLYAHFVEDETYKNLDFVAIDNDTAWAVKAKDTNNIEQTIHIPSTYKGLPVLEIADDGFWNKGQTANKITTDIIIDDGITKIGSQTFLYYNSLINLRLPNTLQEIGNSAFQGTMDLKTVQLPSGLTTIGEAAFAANRFDSITIPNTVTEIGGQAFDQTGNSNAVQTLKTIIFEDGGTAPLDIYERAFAGALITTLTLPQQMNRLGARLSGSVFEETNNLKTVYINKSIEDGEIVAEYDPFLIFSSTASNFVSNPNITIYLPNQSTLEYYQQSNNWSNYKDQMQVM